MSSTLSKLQDTINAGQDVLSQCGGGGGSAPAATGAGQALSSRQIGDLTCNVNRLKIVAALAESTAAVTAVQVAANG